jgi:flagellar protein FliS
MNRARNHYLTTQINTATPGELTLLLFNGSIKFMKQAIDAIEHKNYSEKNINLVRSQDIIDELLITLNMEYEISKNLASLYIFMKESLITANLKLDKVPVQNCIGLMTELRDTWVEALKQLKTATIVGS